MQVERTPFLREILFTQGDDSANEQSRYIGPRAQLRVPDHVRIREPHQAQRFAARMLRAELPVQRNRTLYGRSAMVCANRTSSVLSPCRSRRPGTAPETPRSPAPLGARYFVQ